MMRTIRHPGTSVYDTRTGTLGAAMGQYPVIIALMTLGGLGAGLVLTSRLKQLVRVPR